MVTVRLIKPTITAAVICLSLNCATIAAADGIGGYAEYNYSLLDSKLNDTNGTTKTKSSSLNQRYSLALDKSLFPTLRLSATGNFETSSADNDVDSVRTTSASSRINTNADLSYTNGVFNGGTGFSKRQETAKSNGVSTPALLSDTYNVRFGWKPDDFPSLDIIYTRFNNYDENHSAIDTVASTATISSRYKPNETLDMNYSANYTALNNKLNGSESQSLGQSLRTSYSDIFFKDRVSLSSSYTIALQNTTSNNSTPIPKSIDQLYFAPTAISADSLTTPPLGGPLNLNSVPTVNGTVISDASLTQVRNNVGLKLNFSAVSIIRLPVVISVIAGHTISTTDYTNVTNAFGLDNVATSKIKVYQSQSSDGANWQPLPVTSITFGTMTNPTTGALTDGFEITPVTAIPSTTLIKVEIETVQNAMINFSIQKISLSVPEAYFQDTTISSLKPGQSRTSSQISGLFGMNLKTRLLTTPALFYDIGFNLDHTKSDVQAFTYRYTVVNGLNLNHRLNQTLSTSARVAREDTVSPTVGASSSNSASISFSSQTLPTLSQSATYGFREENSAGNSRTSHSMNLSNSAELYRGIYLSLGGGGSMVTNSTGLNQKSLTVTSGLNLTPHKTVSINLSASDSENWASGAGKPETSSATRTGDLTATYNPFPAIYLFGSYVINAQTNRKTQTAQSIGGSWSPFRGGALLLNTSYRENIDNSGNKDSSFVQSLRWNIRAGWYLDVSYLTSKNSVTSQKTDTQVFNAALRLSI